MMAKLHIDKIGGPKPVRIETHRGAKISDTGQGQPIGNRRADNEDKLEISNRGVEVGSLVEQMKGLPETRQELVDTLRGQIAAGTFNPSSDEIADAILNDEKN